MRTAISLWISSFLIFLAVPNHASQRLNDQLCAQVDLMINEQITKMINRFKETKAGEKFLKSHDETNLRKTITFLQYPKDNFAAIQDIPDFCAYIWAFQLFLYNKQEIPLDEGFNDFFEFLSSNFRTADCQNVPILTHLILICDSALFEDALINVYTTLFEFHYEIFLKDLQQRKNWKNVINPLLSGDWRAFKAGLAKLGTSVFELELKAYVASLEKIQIKSEDNGPSWIVERRGV